MKGGRLSLWCESGKAGKMHIKSVPWLSRGTVGDGADGVVLPCRAHLVAWEQQCLSSWRQTEANFASFSKVANGHLSNTKRTMVHYLGHVDDSNRTMSEALQGLLLIDAELEDSTVSW